MSTPSRLESTAIEPLLSLRGSKGEEDEVDFVGIRQSTCLYVASTELT